MEPPRKHVTIYTDGACIGNPGPGGYAAVLTHGNHVREITGAFKRTTNNRMELLAAIEALRALKEPCTVTIYSDSQYVTNPISQGWLWQWIAQGGANKNGDLWDQMAELLKVHEVTAEWVRGHSGVVGNERANTLANDAAHHAARRTADVPADEGYVAVGRVPV